MKRSYTVLVVALLLLALSAISVYGGGRGAIVSVISSLVGAGFNLLVAIACWQAARRSRDFARNFWGLLSSAFFLAVAAEVLLTYYEKILHGSLLTAWPSIVFVFLVGAPIALTLLLSEGPTGTDVRWEQTLDLAQLGILAISVFLVFFYVPTLAVVSDAALAWKALQLHVVRDGFFFVAFAARGLTAHSRTARALFTRVSVFFLIYGLASVTYLYGRAVWHFGPDNPLDLLVDAVLILLVALAATWRPIQEDLSSASVRGAILPAHFVPLLFPFVVLGLASRLGPDQLVVAWLAVGASYACAAARVVVTQRNQRRAVLAMHQSESRYRDLVENMAEVVYRTDLEARVTFVSAGVEKVLGYTPEEVRGRSLLEFVVPEQRPRLQARMAERMAGTPGAAEWPVYSKSGKVRWIYALSYPALKDGRIVGVSGVFMDITDRKAMEERFLKAFHASPAAMTISRLEDGRYIDVNERYLRMMGMERDEMIGHTSVELGFWSAEERADFADALRRDGVLHDREIVFHARDGSLRTTIVSAERVDIGGDPTVLTAVQDVTELRKMEAQLRQKQKMEAIGALAGGVAHDFNNLLTVIAGYSELLEDRAQDDAAMRDDLRQIRAAADRAASLTRQLLAFSRQQVLHPQVLSLNDALKNVEKLLRRLIGEDVKLFTDYRPDTWTVKADPGQIEQVVMNLAVNARDAMTAGGTLTFATCNVEADALELGLHPVMPRQTYVKLSVSDTGSGMDADTLARIFEPFFTTKKAGEGTGLGLATVYGIVKQSGGYVWADSRPGEGTRFDIYLPRCEPAAPSPSAPPAETRRAGQGNETILLVEDDPGVRRLAAAALTAHGYTVLEAAGGREAEAISQRHAGEIHLLLADMVMPELSGREVAERIRRQRPQVRLLFMSGYSAGTHSWNAEPQAGESLLQKPFSAVSLAEIVRSVLDGGGRTGMAQ